MCKPGYSPISIDGQRVEAVIFDLDGTLTEPYFDFDAIRQEIGLPTEPRTPILEAIEQMAPQERMRAEAIIQRHEEEGAQASELRDDAREVMAAIRSQSIPVGLLTRNSRQSVETVIAKHQMQFDAIYTREDGPIKPSPVPVLELCRRFAVGAESAVVVGDYLFDIQAGNAAGATTVLMIGDGPKPDFSDQADYVIHRLQELLMLLSFPEVDK
ncbi:MAG: HAD family hydrolase [Planctomycetota bacterium]|nr:MAG: HAD family hydrolase [Planctomycetota bacterium]